MSLLLKIHRPIEKSDFKKLWKNGVFIFDTNVLLNLYRLPASAKNDFIKILNDPKIFNRIWIPFQVSLEFLNNRISVISDQKKAFTQVESAMREFQGQMESAFEDMSGKLAKLQLGTRHSLISPDEFTSRTIIDATNAALNEKLDALEQLNKKQPDVNEKDPLFADVERIFKGKVGECFSSEELERIYQEGKDRYSVRLPPGYKDQDKGAINEETGESKSEFYFYEDKQILREFGDLIIWQEILQKAKVEELSHVVFVTDELKEHWVRQRRGKKLGVRYELLNEIYYHAPSVELFHIYNTANFMEYAKEYLKIEITSEAIKKTRDLSESDRERTLQRIQFRLGKSKGYVLGNSAEGAPRVPLAPNIDMILRREASVSEVRFIRGFRDYVMHLPPSKLRTLFVVGLRMLGLPEYAVAEVSPMVTTRISGDDTVYKKFKVVFSPYHIVLEDNAGVERPTSLTTINEGKKSFPFGFVRAFSLPDGRKRLNIYLPADFVSVADETDREYLI